ncbi:MAG: ATP-binding protein [Longimicrobiales bacterium]
MSDRLSQLDLRRVLDSLGEGVTLADRDGRIFFSNAAADRILGVQFTDGAPDTWAEHYGVFHPDGVTEVQPDEYPLVRALKGESTDEVEVLIRNPARPDGVRVLATARPLRGIDGGIEGASVVFWDVTEIRDVELRLSRTNAELRSAHRKKDELFSFVLHDIKGPATTLAVLTELLNMGAVEADEETVRDLYLAARHLSRMTLDVLDAQLAEDGVLQIDAEEVVVSSFLARVVADMEPAAGVRGLSLAGRTSGNETFWADRRLMERVLQNLVQNGLKFGPQGSRVLVEAHVDAAGVRLEVSDDGPGVPPSLREAVFERYSVVERRDDRAANSRGLGLRFCKVAVEAHGGSITVEDSTSGGARFIVWLPPAGARESHPTGYRILVSHAEDSVRGAIARLLARAGLRPIVARSGAEAITILTVQPIDAIIVDLPTPERDGSALIAAAQKMDPGLPVIVLSGGSGSGRSVILGPDQQPDALRTIEMPFRSDILVEAVLASIQERGDRQDEA